MNACEAGEIEAVELLLAFELDQIDYVCENGSAIHAAITGKDPFNTVSFLLNSKPNVANLVDLSGITPLFLASYQGDLNVVNLLLSLGAEPQK